MYCKGVSFLILGFGLDGDPLKKVLEGFIGFGALVSHFGVQSFQA